MSDVHIGFKLLLAALELEVEKAKKELMQALLIDNLTVSAELFEKTARMGDIYVVCLAQQEQWDALLQQHVETKEALETTPQENYKVPILKALIRLRGSAQIQQVLHIVEQTMTLLPADKECLPSGMVRWQNRAQWARLELVRDGYMQRSTERGVWAITEAGRIYAFKSTVVAL